MSVYKPHYLEQLSKAQLIEVVLDQDREVTALQGQVTTLVTEVQVLRAKIQAFEKDSTNSSKPPSTDFQTKRTQSLRQKSNKKSGGQKGHNGITRMQTATPDSIETCRPEHCDNCGENLTDNPSIITGKRQEADIPPIQVQITEYQQETVTCNHCGHNTKGTFPKHITAPFQIGENLKATIVYLNIAHHIPFDRCTKLIDDLLSVRLSEGTIDSTLSQAHEKARELLTEILKGIKKGKWVGSDETGTRVGGKKWWQWVWQNRNGSYYVIEPGRGYAIVEKHFGEDFLGTLVADCWSAQNNTRARSHQHCHPHYLRDLQFCIETEGSKWAYEAFHFLLASERARDVIWNDAFDETLRKTIITSYEERLQELTERSIVGKDSRRIQKRMRKHHEKILHFMHDPDIPFHNNSSEQAIRNAKLHKKISGGFRSEYGARRHAALLSVIETCKKRNMDILGSLKLMFQGKLSFQGT
jgi:transposase